MDIDFRNYARLVNCEPFEVPDDVKDKIREVRGMVHRIRSGPLDIATLLVIAFQQEKTKPKTKARSNG